MKPNPLTPEPTFETDLNPCPGCGSRNLEPSFVASRYWRGWSVECLDCGEVTDYDEPEKPPEYRSI